MSKVLKSIQSNPGLKWLAFIGYTAAEFALIYYLIVGVASWIG